MPEPPGINGQSSMRTKSPPPRPKSKEAASGGTSQDLLWKAALVAAVALVCFVQTAAYGFVYDDDVQIVRNPRIRDFSLAWKAFFENFWAFRAPVSFSNYYRPLQTMTYMAGYALSGLSPVAYHVINILLHVLSSLAVFWIGWELFERSEPALWGGLLFAVHPMHTESVAWIAGVTDLGCGLFYFIAIASYLHAHKREKGRAVWPLISSLSFLISLFFKEMALTLPFVAALLDLLLERRTWMERIKRWTPFAVTIAVYLALRLTALGAFSRAAIALLIDPFDRAMTVLHFVALYFQKLVIPLGHNAYYVFRPFSGLSHFEWAPGFVLLGGIAFLLYRYARPHSKALFLSLWPFITLAPVLNLGTVGLNMFTERYLYIPSLGVCLLIPALVFIHCSESVQIVARNIGVALILVLAGLTIWRNTIWKDNKTFYTATLSVSPDAAAFHNNLGVVYFKEGNLAAARREFESALRANEAAFLRSEPEQSSSYLGLSSVANAEGKLEEALRSAQEALRRKPDSDDAHQTLGMLLAKTGRYKESEELMRKALEINPSNSAAHVNLGNLLMIRNDLAGAEREFRLAMELDPLSAGPRVSLGALLFRTGHTSEARGVIGEALRLEPANFHARQILQAIDSGKSPTR